MKTVERRFEQLRKAGGYNLAFARLSNAAFLLGYEKEVNAEHAFHEKVKVVTQAFRVEAGHKVVNFLRYREVLPPLSYHSVIRRAAKEMGVPAMTKDPSDWIEEQVVRAALHLREPWDPRSEAHRERLKAELNRRMRTAKLDLKGKLTRALSTGLTLRSLKSGVPGLPYWAKRGTAAGILATGIYGAYKLGDPDYSRVILPSILLFALVRSDLEVAVVSAVQPEAKLTMQSKNPG